MKFECTEVWGFSHAMRGMRNPKNSWSRGDTVVYNKNDDSNPAELYSLGRPLSEKGNDFVYIGENDMKLAQTLIRGGSEHRKFMRQIFVSVDITAPFYWWKEYDTYKVGTVANSTSTMHKITSQPIALECFETDDYHPELTVPTSNYPWEPDAEVGDYVDDFIGFLEKLRLKYLETNDKRYWKELIRWAPVAWMQKRTLTFNYENLFAIVHQRMNHKLNEWSGKDFPANPNFIAWAHTLPYAEELIFLGGDPE